MPRLTAYTTKRKHKCSIPPRETWRISIKGPYRNAFLVCDFRSRKSVQRYELFATYEKKLPHHYGELIVFIVLSFLKHHIHNILHTHSWDYIQTRTAFQAAHGCGCHLAVRRNDFRPYRCAAAAGHRPYHPAAAAE